MPFPFSVHIADFSWIITNVVQKDEHNQGRDERGKRGTIPLAPNHCGDAENPNSFASTFFTTVHSLPKHRRFEHEGAKLVSCPQTPSNLAMPLNTMTSCLWLARRHLASCGPWIKKLSSYSVVLTLECHRWSTALFSAYSEPWAMGFYRREFRNGDRPTDLNFDT